MRHKLDKKTQDEIRAMVRKRTALRILQEQVEMERLKLDKRLGGINRQIRRLSDKELAEEYGTTPYWIRKIAYQ